MSAESTEPGLRRFFTRVGRRATTNTTPRSRSRSRSRSVSESRVSLCLAVVVDGDAHLLASLASSVRPHISHWLVLTEGGDDELVRAIAEREFANLPGEVVTGGRDDMFAHVPAEATHVLVLEPDMELVAGATLADLVRGAPGDVLVVRVDDNGWEHRRPLIVRTGREWSFTGDARGSLTCGERFVSVEFEPAYVVRHADGARIARHLARERERLYARIEADTSDASTMFRLAKTLADLGETSPAIWWFTKCAEARGRGEEAYCSWYFIGELHLLHDRTHEAASAFMHAVEVRPSRYEAYFQLARLCNAQRDFAMARMWAEAGMLQRASRDSMYVQPWMRRWGLPFQWASAAWWTGDARAARSMFESLNESQLLSEPYASQAASYSTRTVPGEEPLRFDISR